VNLTDLLQTRDIAHPTRVARASLQGDRLSLTVQGHPWWKRDPQPGEESTLELIFEGISWGTLDLTLSAAEWDEVLEDFRVQPLVDVDWAQPDARSIFCYAPLPDPFRLYAALHEWLRDRDAFKTAADFLNSGDDITRFAEITATQSYLVAKGPEIITQILCDELSRQDVPFEVHTFDLPTDRRLWVRLGAADFLCERAVAEV
jgi:hypothetical protein